MSTDTKEVFEEQLRRLSAAADEATDSMELCALTASMLDVAKLLDGSSASKGQRQAPASVSV